MSAEAKKATFSKTGLTRSNISFAEGDQYAFLRLNRSKTDTEHKGIPIILAATNKQTCHRASMRKLCTQDPRLPNALLFRLQSVAFSRQSVVNILKQRIASEGLLESNFSAHSFRIHAVADSDASGPCVVPSFYILRLSCLAVARNAIRISSSSSSSGYEPG